MTDIPPARRSYAVPFNRPSFAGREMEHIAAAVASGHLSGDGAFTRLCQELLESEVHVAKALLTPSCTAALELSALLLDLQPGDEVIVPSFTFVSTANAFAMYGARPVFVDVRPDTMNLDEGRLEAAISTRTRAVVAVHYAGVGCEMDAITRTTEAAGIDLIEDNAHGLFGTYRGRPLGSFGRFSTLSFHETKNISAGEGGALLMTHPEDVQRAEILREKGTNRSRFFRGQVDKYTWVDLGSSYLPSELTAAVLWGQLEQREAIQATRQRLWARYGEGLAAWAGNAGVTLPVVPAERHQPAHLFHLLMPSGQARDAIIQHLGQRGILAVFHYLPLHLSPMGRQFGGKPGDCPVTEDVSERLVRLPLFAALSDADQDQVIEAVTSFEVATHA